MLRSMLRSIGEMNWLKTLKCSEDRANSIFRNEISSSVLLGL